MTAGWHVSWWHAQQQTPPLPSSCTGEAAAIVYHHTLYIFWPSSRSVVHHVSSCFHVVTVDS
jgi:hypothetical protein